MYFVVQNSCKLQREIMIIVIILFLEMEEKET